MEPIKVVIILDGGLIQDILISSGKIEAYVIDYNIQGLAPEDIMTVSFSASDGEPVKEQASVSHWEKLEADRNSLNSWRKTLTGISRKRQNPKGRKMKLQDQSLFFKGKKLSKSLINKMGREELIQIILEQKEFMFSSYLLWVPLIYLRKALITELFQAEEAVRAKEIG
jgi:hypothetical protein